MNLDWVEALPFGVTPIVVMLIIWVPAIFLLLRKAQKKRKESFKLAGLDKEVEDAKRRQRGEYKEVLG